VAMNSFYEHHEDSIHWHYRCFDRILLNGLIQPFQQPERVVGFFNTYRQPYPVTRYTLRDIADQFQRWVKERAVKRNIPIVEAPKGRRDEFVDPYFERAKPDAIVVILPSATRSRTAGTSSSRNAGSFNTTFTSMTGTGDECSCASARTFHSPPVSASTSTIGWPTACASKASDSSKPPMPS
jgi:hypothetical protein